MNFTQMQEFLAKRKYYTKKIDGIYGSGTRTAINLLLRDNQKAYGYDYSSWDENRRVIAAEQIIYKAYGIDSGKVDGLVGPATTNARNAYAYFLQYGKLPTATPPKPTTPVVSPVNNTDPKSQFYAPLQANMESYYGKPGTGHTRLQLPFPMRIAWDKKTVVTSFVIHQKAAPTALIAFNRVKEAYSMTEIQTHGFDLFGGCFNDRNIRNGTKKSCHAYAAAIDFDPERNQLNTPWKASYFGRTAACQKFFDIWKEVGWTALGPAANFDSMHIQHPRLR